MDLYSQDELLLPDWQAMSGFMLALLAILQCVGGALLLAECTQSLSIYAYPPLLLIPGLILLRVSCRRVPRIGVACMTPALLFGWLTLLLHAAMLWDWLRHCH